MAENTKIEWADHTFNPWVGCTNVSPACDHCYAEAWAKRAGKAAGVTWGGERRRTSAANWRKPIQWNAQAEREGRRFKVFCASLGDVFDNQVPPEWRADLFELIKSTPRLDWLLLTKRIGNAAEMIRAAESSTDIGYAVDFAAWPWPNVWIGATICNQAEADRDIPKLLAVPAAKRFLSIEPMLGPIDLDLVARKPCQNAAYNGIHMDPETGTFECCRACDFTGLSDEWGIDWVIVGGESGPNARPMHPDWPHSLRDQCAAAGVPFMFKQWGEWVEAHRDLPRQTVHMDSETGKVLALECDGFISQSGDFVRRMDAATTDDPYRGLQRIGKKAAGRLLDGEQHDGSPS